MGTIVNTDAATNFWGELPAKIYAENKLDIRRSAIDAIKASL